MNVKWHIIFEKKGFPEYVFSLSKFLKYFYLVYKNINESQYVYILFLNCYWKFVRHENI